MPRQYKLFGSRIFNGKIYERVDNYLHKESARADANMWIMAGYLTRVVKHRIPGSRSYEYSLFARKKGSKFP